MSLHNIIARASNLLLLTIIPSMYGCGAGGGGSASVGSLFGGSSGSGGESLASLSVTNSGMTAVHNPEPGTLLLLGGGMMALGFFQSKLK